MIIVKKIEGSGYKREDYESADYQLLIDGEFLPEVNVRGSKNNSKEELVFEFFTNDIYSSEKILTQQVKDFPKFEYINIPVDLKIVDFENDFYLFNEIDSLNTQRINFYFIAKLLSWKQSYSFEDFEANLLKFRSKNIDSKLDIKSHNTGEDVQFSIETRLELGNLSLKEELTPFFEKCLNIYWQIQERTIKEKKTKTINNSFSFPEEIKIYCEQYLLYFAHFLQDLGINATSNLKEEAGKVLFSVTPIDDVEALDKIREALAVYLNLPSRPIVYDESFAAMRLKQQVDNLQHAQRMTEMEFRLAQKVIESQDKIIQQKDSTIEHQSRILEKITDKAIMINSAENNEELEEIFDGIKVGRSKFLAEQIGLHLNPATALKSVGKKFIGKDGEFISLNLNDENDSKDI